MKKTLRDKQITNRRDTSLRHKEHSPQYWCVQRMRHPLLFTHPCNSKLLVKPEKYLSSWGRQQPHEEP